MTQKLQDSDSEANALLSTETAEAVMSSGAASSSSNTAGGRLWSKLCTMLRRLLPFSFYEVEVKSKPIAPEHTLSMCALAFIAMWIIAFAGSVYFYYVEDVSIETTVSVRLYGVQVVV